MQPIFLIGFMGSGKSTLGRALSRATGLTFIDLDNYIEQRFHANVRDIFASRGEDGFRDLERRMLREVSQFEDVIVACGGGTPCFFDNMEIMNSAGTTVMLDVSHARLFQRLKLGRHRRPLIAGMTDEELSHYIDSALEKRLSYYSQAANTFSGEYLDNAEQISDTISRFIERFGLTSINTSVKP